MKIKTALIFLLSFGILLSSVSSPSLALKKSKKNQNKKQQETVIIPKEVKTVFEEGIKTREARLDIPFDIVKHLYLPARENLHCIFFFRVKNADLGFVPVAPSSPAAPEGEEEKKGEKADEPAPEAPAATLQAQAHFFVQFNSLDENFEKEIYIPIDFQIPTDSYDPEKEEVYSTAYPLPAGNYLLSLAIASQKLEKIGTQYFEFSLPDQLSFTDTLDTAPIFFCNNINQMSAPETKVEIHKGFFTYSILQIYPKIENTFSVGENLDIFFFIFGAKPDENGSYSIEVNYEVLEGEEKVIRYASTSYTSPLVSQPLPMKKTVVITTQKEGGEVEEKKESRDLDPGLYTLSLNIKDNVTGLTLSKSVDFEVK